jgi:hypothetical protein
MPKRWTEADQKRKAGRLKGRDGEIAKVMTLFHFNNATTLSFNIGYDWSISLAQGAWDLRLHGIALHINCGV